MFHFYNNETLIKENKMYVGHYISIMVPIHVCVFVWIFIVINNYVFGEIPAADHN